MVRELQITTGALRHITKVNLEGSDWKDLLVNTNEVEVIHTIFEDLFMEDIPRPQIDFFMVKYSKLTKERKEQFIDILLKRYEANGEYGFATIALQGLARF